MGPWLRGRLPSPSLQGANGRLVIYRHPFETFQSSPVLHFFIFESPSNLAFPNFYISTPPRTGLDAIIMSFSRSHRKRSSTSSVSSATSTTSDYTADSPSFTPQTTPLINLVSPRLSATEYINPYANGNKSPTTYQQPTMPFPNKITNDDLYV